HDAEHTAAIPAVHRDHPVAIVADLAGMGERRALDRLVIGANRRQHAQPVLIDVDARAGGAQALPALVHAYAPAALRQRTGRGPACAARAGDCGVPFPGAILWHRAIEGSPRQGAGAMMAGEGASARRMRWHVCATLQSAGRSWTRRRRSTPTCSTSSASAAGVWDSAPPSTSGEAVAISRWS